MKNSQNIVFIFGAGASGSISEKVPLMNDFFRKAAEYLQDPVKYPAVWLAFIMIERYRLFQSTNAHLENLAMFILDDHWHMLELSRPVHGQSRKTDTEEYRRIEKQWLKWTELYREGIIKDLSRCKANLETVFGRAEKQLIEKEEDDAFVRLLFAINSIFCELRKEFPESPLHNKLSETLRKRLEQNLKINLSFISFNYDIWLERAMQKVGIWSPRNGYGITLDKFIDVEIARESDEQDQKIRRNVGGAIRDFKVSETEIGESRTIILKPHGSLSWFYNKDLNDYFILLDKKQDGIVADNEGRWHIRSIRGDIDFELRTYEPLLIPPTPLKRRSHSIFWKIDKRVEEELSSADLVVIIGWSMPETDIDYIQKIKHIFGHRSEQLQRLIVCDIKRDNSLYFNFESIFRPSTPVVIHSSGFNDDFLVGLENLLS